MMLSGTVVAMMIIVAALLRYVFKIDFYGSEEFTLLAGFWLYFVGSISACRGKSQLNADMVTVFTKNKQIIRIFALLRDLLSLGICLLVVKWCWDYFSWQWMLHPVTSVHRIPKTFQQFPMCFSFVMWGIYLIRDCIKAFCAFSQGGNEE